MEVILAKCAGACYGVQRALDLAKAQAEGGIRAQTLGPLIHNPQVVEQLAQQGVGVAQGIEDISGDCVIIRSHGITPEALAALKKKQLKIVNATCPHVIRAQEAASELARKHGRVLIVGEEEHPEVMGLRAWAKETGAEVYVANAPDALPEELSGPVGVVVQTTQSEKLFSEVLAALDARGIEADVKNTICSATAKRQEAAAHLASRVDAMVVIGGHNSSNTCRLYEICQSFAPKALHIEAPSELKREDLAACATVGVTAGASTPKGQIDAVIALLESWD